MKSFIVAMTFVLFAGLTFAEDKAPTKFVRVSGTAEVKVVPDRAVIELGVERQNASARLAKQAADAAARKILDSLHANGIEEKDIQTSYLSLRPEYDYRKAMTISNFVAQQSLTVTIRDLTKVDKLLQDLIIAGGNRIDSIRYETSELRKYRDQARELAVKAAREKAEALAHALGQEIGKAQLIEELPESQYATFGYLANNSLEEAPAKSRGPSTAPGQDRISASINVSFELL